jgi:KaiC/GvpD/RAD55 family RecA-like ATPase
MSVKSESEGQSSEKKSAINEITAEVRNLQDLLAEVTNGREVNRSVVASVNREHQMIVAAVHRPGSTVGSGLEPRHFECSDYRALWRAICVVYARFTAARAAGQRDVPDVIVSEDLLAEAILVDDVRFGTPWARRFIGRLCEEEPVSNYRATELIPAELKSKVSLKDFAATIQNWAKDIPATSSPVQLQQALAMHAREFSRHVTEDIRVEDPCDLADWRSAQKHGGVIRTFFPEIDDPTGGGLGRGELMVIGGGTGHGKSFFSTAMLKRQFESEHFHKTLYVSLEDSAEVLRARLMSQYLPGGVTAAQIRQKLNGYNSISDEQMDQAAASMSRFRGRVETVHAPKWSLERIASLIRARRHVAGIDMVVIDYLQAVTSENKRHRQDRTAETSEAVATLKRLAHELGIALVITSQYSRDEYKNGQEPSITACKYAGDVENEAEVMLLMWRDENSDLFVKLAKMKWASAKGHRYRIQTDPNTGELLDWIKQVELPPEPAEAKTKRRSYGGAR